MTTHEHAPHVHHPLLRQHPPSPSSVQRTATVDIPSLEQALRANVEGEVRVDAGSLALYATDASNYRQVPLAVVIPRSVEDVVATVKACREHGAPLLSRAGGTSLAGQCCNTAVVMDWSKYLHNILEINPQHSHARVQPGVICDDVAKAAREYKLTWGPAPATHNHCCFGGMLGNNSCGVHAQYAGKAVDNTESMEVLLYDGTRMHVGWIGIQEMEQRAREGGRIGGIYSALDQLRARYQPLIRDRFPKLLRRVSGYNLDQLLPDEHGRINVARALVGSEGTCVTMLEAKVHLVYNHPHRVTLVLGYPDVYLAADHVMQIREFQPIGLEGLDSRLVHNIQQKGGPHRDYLPLLPEGNGFLLVEFGDDSLEAATAQAHAMMAALRKDRHPPHMRLLVDKQEQHHVWQVRESGLGATAFVPGQPDAWPGWEDSAVSPEKLGSYLRDLRALYQRFGYNPSLYGHFGQGCVHCRVEFDLASQPGIQKYKAFMDDATDMIVRYGGSYSGEHGDGQSRAQYLPKLFGAELMQAFREFKAIWDPDNKMNPGRVVEASRVDENLRMGAHYRNAAPLTWFKFLEDGGSFGHATLRCVGVGKCRRMEGEGINQTMCPSYMVTREEKHTTRGRAHALWEMLHGNVLADGWRDEHVKETLDLCLACKGCKGDCPVNVDIATYKAEFLAHYHDGRLRPIQAYAFGLVDQWARLASLVPGLANLATQTPGLSALAKWMVNIPQQRRIPAFAPQTFQAWFARHAPQAKPDRPKVVLWPDTFNNHFFPQTARAAVQVLEHAGFDVQVPRGHVCCGRPLYDFGFLDLAQRYLRKCMDVLEPYVQAGTPIVALEPSCCSVFRDELHGMFPDDARANALRSKVLTLAELLDGKDGYTPPRLHRAAMVHGHCHHKSVLRMKPDKDLLQRMELDATTLNSGCCGMAGSFGFEKEKYEVSVACGERVLLPAVRDAPLSTFIINDGFSCREQIAQGTQRHALHLAEVMQQALQHGPRGPGSVMPEDELVHEHHRAVKRSMWRAGAVVVAVLGAAAVWRRFNRRLRAQQRT